MLMPDQPTLAAAPPVPAPLSAVQSPLPQELPDTGSRSEAAPQSQPQGGHAEEDGSVGRRAFLRSALQTVGGACAIGSVGALAACDSSPTRATAPTNDVSVLTTWIDGLSSAGTGQRCELPPGRYVLPGTQILEDVTSPVLIGSTSFATTLKWNGAPTESAFRLLDVTNGEIGQLYINASADQPCDSVFQIENGPDSTNVPTRDYLHDLECEGTNGGFNYGVRWALGAGGDFNNDLTLLSNVRIRNFTQAAFRIDHSQSVQHTFVSCEASAGSTGKYMVYLAHGQFRWLNGGGGDCSVADFYIVNCDGGVPIVIDGHDSEGSKRLIEMQNVLGQSSICIRNTRYADNKLHADGYAVKLRGAGPFILEGNTWRTGRLWISAEGYFPLEITLRGNSYIVGPPGGPYRSPYAFGAIHKGSGITVEGELYTDTDTMPLDLSTFPSGASTPQVFAGHQFYTANDEPTLICDFSDGWDTHSFALIAGDANTTIGHGTRIQVKRGENVRLATGQTIRFVNDQGVWREV